MNTSPGAAVRERLRHRPDLVDALRRDIRLADNKGPDWPRVVEHAVLRQDLQWVLEERHRKESPMGDLYVIHTGEESKPHAAAGSLLAARRAVREDFGVNVLPYDKGKWMAALEHGGNVYVHRLAVVVKPGVLGGAS